MIAQAVINHIETAARVDGAVGRDSYHKEDLGSLHGMPEGTCVETCADPDQPEPIAILVCTSDDIGDIIGTGYWFEDALLEAQKTVREWRKES